MGLGPPALDLDFPMIEYSYGVPQALVEYKDWRAAVKLVTPSFKALGSLYNKKGEQILRLGVAFYWREPIAFLVVP